MFFWGDFFADYKYFLLICVLINITLVMDEEKRKEIKYISPTTDFGFKKVFGDERMMKSFLNALFDSQNLGIKIESLEYIDKEALGSDKQNRGVIYDLKCHTSNGEEILVEMQNEGQDFFENRIIYYMARAVSIQGFKKVRNKIGEEKLEEDETWDFDIHRVIGVFLMNYYDKNDLEPVSRNCWTNVNSGKISSDRQEYWKVQLPYYRRHNKKPEECANKLDYWLYNISNMDTMSELAFKEKEPDFVYLSNLANFNAMSVQEQNRYIYNIDQEVVYNNVMERRYRDGKTEGERLQTLSIARNAKNLGYSVDQIVALTGLTPDEIENL